MAGIIVAVSRGAFPTRRQVETLERTGDHRFRRGAGNLRSERRVGDKKNPAQVGQLVGQAPRTNTPVTLDELVGQYASGIHSAVVFSDIVIPGDTNYDRKIDLADYTFVLGMQGFKGKTIADTGSNKGRGLPDGIVDGWDKRYAWENLSDADKGLVPEPAIPTTPTDPTNPIQPTPPVVQEGYLVEGFESGAFGAGWSASKWAIASDEYYTGGHSARTERIGDNEECALIYKGLCAKGNMSYWRKASSEHGPDMLEVYVNGVRQISWKGEYEWKEDFINIAAGTNTIKFRCFKDSPGSGGQDRTWWIDYVRIPVAAAN